MKALIIGAAGFVGGYLISELSERGFEVSATKLPFETLSIESAPKCRVFDLDVTDASATNKLITELRPDRIFHLAAQSSVKASWEKPELTLKVNVIGALNVLEACRALKETGASPRVLMIGSAEEYGKVAPEECPIREDRTPTPKNIYALSKMTQNHLGNIYSEAYGLDIINVRAFNHTGPMQSATFVVADFCAQVARIEAGLQAPIISVGNLDAMRDFTDVRDIVRAYTMLSDNGKAGETYNVGSGKATCISDVLELIIKKAKCEIQVAFPLPTL